MASLKLWSGFKIPHKRANRLSKYGNQTRKKSSIQKTSEPLPKVGSLETEKLEVKVQYLTPETRFTPCFRTHQVEQIHLPISHNQTQVCTNEETDTEFAFLHLIGQNRFPTLERSKWWGLNKERTQIICSVANKIYKEHSMPDESQDIPKPEYKMHARNEIIGIMHPKDMKVASFTSTLERPKATIHKFDGSALRSKLSLNQVFMFQPPYPRLQPNSSKFAEGLLNCPIHFVAVKRAFSLSCLSQQNIADAEAVTVNQTNQSEHSPVRKQFLRSCAEPNKNLKRESYTRDTINKMSSVIKRLPSMKVVKQAEMNPKPGAVAKSDDKFGRNVYFLGNKAFINSALKESTTKGTFSYPNSALDKTVYELQQDVNKLSQEKIVLNTEVKDLSEKLEGLAQQETDLKSEIVSLNSQFNAISNENREMFKVKEATSNLVQELCLRRDVLAKEEEILWTKLERLNKRISDKCKSLSPYSNYNDILSMESMLGSETDLVKCKAGNFLHKKISPDLNDGDNSGLENEAENPEDQCSNRTALKARIMEANKHRFKRCEIPLRKDRRLKRATGPKVKKDNS